MIKVDLLRRSGKKPVERRGLSTWIGLFLIVVVLTAAVIIFQMRGEKLPTPPAGPEMKKEVEEIEEVVKARVPRNVCLTVLKEIQNAIPHFVWLTFVSTNPVGDYFLQGIAFSDARAKEFLRNLEEASSVHKVKSGRLNNAETFQFTVWGTVPVTHMGGEELELKLLTEEEFDSLTEMIQREGERLGLEFTPSPASEVALNKKRERLWVEGRYSQVNAFLNYLGELYKPVSASHLIIIPADSEQGRSDRVEMFITLDFYLQEPIGNSQVERSF